MLLGSVLFAQEKQKQVLTVFFKVSGNCEQCKERIENAADIKGVKTSSWDKKTHILKVVYRTDKVTEEKIREAIAKSGHDVDSVVANEADYARLPGCCKYRDRKCEENK